MRRRSIKPHQIQFDEISHKVVGPKARFKTFKHRGQQAGAFGGRLKTVRSADGMATFDDLTTLTEPQGNQP